MPKSFPTKKPGFHPFADLIGFTFTQADEESSVCFLEPHERLFNPHGVVHGGVLYTMADTGMGAALYPHLKDDQLCATLEINIVYFAPVTSGPLTCRTRLIHKGKRIALLESEIMNQDRPAAKATGIYSIFTPRKT